MSYRLSFVGGPCDGEEMILYDLPGEQDMFDGCWIEDVICNGMLAAVPLNRALPNGYAGIFIPEEEED